jgi:hypothetical protein
MDVKMTDIRTIQNYQQAELVLKQFVAELLREDVCWAPAYDVNPEFSGYWYYPFILASNKTEEEQVVVTLPAIPIEEACQPGVRIYVNGSSWWWDQALKEASNELTVKYCEHCGSKIKP